MPEDLLKGMAFRIIKERLKITVKSFDLNLTMLLLTTPGDLLKIAWEIKQGLLRISVRLARWGMQQDVKQLDDFGHSIHLSLSQR